jgi:hypothetical protein
MAEIQPTASAMLEYADRALAADNSNSHGWWVKSIAFDRLGRFAEARDALDQSLRQPPPDCFIWDRRVDLLELDLALRDFDRLKTHLDKFDRDFGPRKYASEIRQLAESVQKPKLSKETAEGKFKWFSGKAKASLEYDQQRDDLWLFERLDMWDELRVAAEKIKDNDYWAGRAMLLADLMQRKDVELEKRLSLVNRSDDAAMLWLTWAIATREKRDFADADARFAKGVEILASLSSVERPVAEQIRSGRASFKDINDLALAPQHKAVLMVAIAQKFPGEGAKFVDQAKGLKARFLGWDAGASYLDVESLLDPVLARLSVDAAAATRK